MDYEKKYNEALERAKLFQEKYGGDYAGYIFPELAESEDERMRKHIIDIVKDNAKSKSIPCDAEIAYLEKLKELPFVKDVIPGYPGLYFYDGERMHFQGNPAMKEKQKEQKPYEPKNWPADKDNLTQEQKPAEWSEEDEKRVKQLIYDTEHIRAEYEKRKKELGESFNDELIKDCDEQITWLKSLNLKKRNEDVAKLYSNEWSEEDEKTINNACCWIAEYAGYLMDKNYSKASMLMSLTGKLKSLRPQLKKEWSEKDETCLEDALWCVMKTRHFVAKDACDLDACRCAEKWLKSLRPSWKPSEEQMEALKEALKTYKGFEEYDAMKSLYEQLKQLK